jgi:hypothetical protein
MQPSIFENEECLQNSNSAARHDVRELYFGLNTHYPQRSVLEEARRYLDSAVQDTFDLAHDLPADMAQLERWVAKSTDEVGQQYQHYLADRKAGEKRRYFKTKSHALYFLKSVAPTKLVDGAWLFGLLRHWRDGRFDSLIKIYLEELGSGEPDKNHVVLFKKLLASHGCDKWQHLSDTYFVQGVIQLALAAHADHFLPEIIGFNLGYEQLPLHLLITAYELNELGIDPYYFTLHVTVDNADTGHAQSALAGLRAAWPAIGDANRFYERVINGYKLNMLGASTLSIIKSFDLKQEVTNILRQKSVTGKQVHSEYCRIAGRSINGWLSKPSNIPAMMDALEESGWIMRHQDPKNSRFWKLLEGERAEMFGVFNAYELQIIGDWIAGDAQQFVDGAASGRHEAEHAKTSQRPLTFKARHKLMAKLEQRSAGVTQSAGSVTTAATSFECDVDAANQATDFNQECRELEQMLKQAGSREEAMDFLVQLMSPARHHSTVGLHATRLFSRMAGFTR